MKQFKEGDIVYAVDPFIFSIEKIKISHDEQYGLTFYYVDDESGYHEECYVFEDIEEAKKEALALLEEFKLRKTIEIVDYKE